LKFVLQTKCGQNAPWCSEKVHILSLDELL
jgi:hypothetical protein